MPLSCRGGNTAVAIAPDGKILINRRCSESFSYVVVTNHVNTRGWGWFRWCCSRDDAEKCVIEEVPRSEASWGFKEIQIVECQMVEPWNLEKYLQETLKQ
jgi:hypothetical protein